MSIGVMLWIAAILAVIPATIAKKRDPDVSFFAWYLYGFLLWIIALTHSILFRVDSAEIVQPRRAGWAQSRGCSLPRQHPGRSRPLSTYKQKGPTG
jgi:hypothetical protein